MEPRSLFDYRPHTPEEQTRVLGKIQRLYPLLLAVDRPYLREIEDDVEAGRINQEDVPVLQAWLVAAGIE
jgi:hypothetical protein